MAVRLKCAVQNYHWGKLGTNSKVAVLAKNNSTDFVVESDKHYAELWMGTHPSGPSRLSDSGQSLHDYIQTNPNVLGQTILQNFGEQLPFLFKVLSVGTALSIQAHPDKELAEKLHVEDPANYKDANHKPEMAIALTDFEGLCGFRPLAQLQLFVKTVPELAAVVGEAAVEELLSARGEDNSEESRAALKHCFASLMRCDPTLIAEKINAMVARLGKETVGIDDDLRELIFRLNSQFPGDVGCFSVFFLNYMLLKPGQAIFLAANLPHAYLSGDCVECMACSDNVVRAGLTPKFKDVDRLVEMLSYTTKTATENLMKPEQQGDDHHVTVFKPTVPDFAVVKVQISEGESYQLGTEPSASIAIVVEGEGHCKELGTVLPGHVVFLPADTTLCFSATHNLLLYRALCFAS